MRRGKVLLGAGLLLIGGGLLVVFLALVLSGAGSDSAASVTATPEPIVPTRTPMRTSTRTSLAQAPTVSPTSVSTSKSTMAPSVEPTPTPKVRASRLVDTPVGVETVASATVPVPVGTATPAATATMHSAVPFWAGRPRWGVGVASGPISRYDVGPLRLGWYLDWQARVAPSRPGGALYAQMIRLSGGQLRPDAARIGEIARANPGSLWLVGNEPDVKWQDNVAPTTYAQLYHDAYAAIKGADPTALVAIGGVSQPTPLRMRYLDMILESYRAQFGSEMPIDVWNVHGFVLREERGSWGVDIPPGIADDQGILYEIADSSNLEAFKRQIVDFRRWMAQRGYQDWPLIVSEYGILMPADYGFPPEVVIPFMTASFDFFLTAVDPGLGYPADGYRLVQMWCWYSLDAPADYYPTGNLFDPETGGMTAVGEGWVGYVE